MKRLLSIVLLAIVSANAAAPVFADVKSAKSIVTGKIDVIQIGKGGATSKASTPTDLPGPTVPKGPRHPGDPWPPQNPPCQQQPCEPVPGGPKDPPIQMYLGAAKPITTFGFAKRY